MPAIVSEETFDLAEERLEMNKIHAPRRTKTPSVLQGLVSCGKCGYALSRTSAQTSARKISYYRCLGSDSWRHLNGPVCDSRPVRQDLLDDVVWGEVVRLLEDPALIGTEIDRRLQAARASDPNQQRENDLRHRLIRVRKSIDRLVNAYQEELITIDELRDRTPELRRQDQALNRELQSAVDRAKDRETYLRLAETLTGFLARLHSSAETLDIAERQRIVRLIVKEVLVTEDKITIRHSIPISGSPGGGPDPSKPGNHSTEGEGYLLRSGRHRPALWRPLGGRADQPILQHARGQEAADQPEQAFVGHPFGHQTHQDVVIDPIEELLQIEIDHDVEARADVVLRTLHRPMSRASGPEPVARVRETGVPIPLQHLHRRLLDEAVEHRRHAERTNAARCFRYLHPPHRLRCVAAVEKPGPDLGPVVLQVIAQVIDCHAVEAGRPFVAPDTSQRLPQITGIDDRLHRRSQPGCRAFGFGVRRAGFGPLVSGAPGFTPRLRLQGQFKLDIPPLGPHERTVLLTLSVVQAFVGKPTTMPSADFCAAITGLANPLSPGLPDTAQTSRGKIDRLHRTPAGFTTPALDGYGLRDHLLARPAG